MSTENTKPIPSPFPYIEIMEVISKMQGEKSTIVILENEDGTTTYLRYKISEEDVAKLLKSAYQINN